MGEKREERRERKTNWREIKTKNGWKRGKERRRERKKRRKWKGERRKMNVKGKKKERKRMRKMKEGKRKEVTTQTSKKLSANHIYDTELAYKIIHVVVVREVNAALTL